MQRSWVVTCIGVALTAAACSGGKVRSDSSADAIPLLGEARSTFVSPAHWAFEPESPEHVLGQLPLEHGRCLLVGEQGTRYVTDPPEGAGSNRDEPPDDEVQDDAAHEGSACEGVTRAASSLAPEALVSVVRQGEHFLFVGQSGTLYEADGPLAPFERRLLPPKPLRKVASAGAAMLSVSLDGELFRFDDARLWTQVHVGPERLYDVAVDERGHALALGVPDVVYASADSGRTFTRVGIGGATDPVGARRVGLSSGGRLVVETARGPHTWAGPPHPLVPTQDRVSVGAAVGELLLGPGRAVGAIMDSRAALSGRGYVQILRADDYSGELEDGGDNPWLLLTGGLEGTLTPRRLAAREECDEVRVGARDRVVVYGCMHFDDEEDTVDVRRSMDGGEHFETVTTLSLVDPDRPERFSLAVSPTGSALLTGVCVSGGDEEGCRGRAALVTLRPPEPTPPKPARPLAKADTKASKTTKPRRERPAQPREVAVQAKAPHVSPSEPPRLPAMSPDGATLYFVARRIKADDRLSLFVSQDGGETFEPRALDLPVLYSEVDGGVVSESALGQEIARQLSVDSDSSLCVDEDGTLGLLAWGPNGLVYLTADEDGRVMRAALAPMLDGKMGGCGSRVFAYGWESNDGTGIDRLLALESLDGGATWARLPPTLALKYVGVDEPVLCSTEGCLIGSVVSRVGWGGQAEPPTDFGTEDSPIRSVPAVGVPLVCELELDTPWTPITHVQGEALTSRGGKGLPSLSDALRGDAVWSVLTHDEPHGKVATVLARSTSRADGSKGKPAKGPLVSEKVLLPASDGRASWTVARHQLEGYAAYRITFPNEKRLSALAAKPLGEVEIAWESFLGVSSGRRRFVPQATFGDVILRQTAGGFAAALGLATITPNGILVRPGVTPDKNPLSYFIDDKGGTRTFEMPTWADVGVVDPVAEDAVRVGDAFFTTGLLNGTDDLATVSLFARRTAAGAELSAETVAPPEDHISEVRWTYAGGELAMTTLEVDPERGRADAALRRFRADGRLAPPEPLPTPYDLGRAARPCTDAERRDTPRLQIPLVVDTTAYFPGLRQPVIAFEALGARPTVRRGSVTPSSAPMELLTDGVVLHGTKAKPCLSGWHAVGLGRQLDVAAIIPADFNEAAWAFRTVSKAGPQGVSIEVKRMTCHLDPTTAVPETVFAAPGTTLSPH